MKISPINFGITKTDKSLSLDSKNYVPTTFRHNSLSDMEFNIIADTIRSQNLRNQMNVRLMHLKKNLDTCMSLDLYQ